MKWNPLPTLRAISRFAYESAAQRIAANILFVVFCAFLSLIGLGFFLAYVTLRRFLGLALVLALLACGVVS